MSKQEPHEHSFDEVVEQKVHLIGGLKSGYDIIKLRKCKCGKTQAFDIKERIEA